MPKETTNVEYRYTGDVSSLKAATEGAIKLLNQYQSKITALTKSDAYTTNQKIAKSMQTAISGTMKEIQKLQSKYKELSEVNLFQGTSTGKQLDSVIQSLQTHLDSFNSKSKVSTKDVKALTEAMRAAKQSFKDTGPSIDTLVAKEKKFQEMLAAIRKGSEAMAQHMKEALDRVSQPFDNVGSKMESLKAKADNFVSKIRQVTEAAGSGFKRVFSSEDGDAAGTSKFAQALKLVTGSITGVTSAADKKSDSLKEETVQTLADILATNKFVIALKVLAKVVTTAARVFSTATQIFSKFKNSLGKFTPKINQVTGALKPLVQLIRSIAVGTVFAKATSEAIEYIENLNLFTVAMGESIDEALKFVDAMSEIYGMDPSNLYKYAGYFNQLTDAIGMSTQASKVMSLSLTKAANDISSLFNKDIESVVENLASGMQGMSRAVRKYGIDIRQTTLQQTALTYGFQENISTTSEANRQALRYLTIMQQIKNATKQVTDSVEGVTTVMGDFARNIETPANQLRILKEQASQVARAFGNFLIPVMQKTLYVINGVLMALKLLLQFLATLAGIDMGSFGGEVSAGADKAVDSVSGIGDAAANAAKKLKTLTAPFDELNVFSETPANGGDLSGLGGDLLDPKLAAAIEAMSLGLDEVRMKALDVRDKILALLGLSFDGSEITVTIGGFIDTLINLWDNAGYTSFGKSISRFLNKGIRWGIENTDPTVYSPLINEKVSILANILNGFVEGFSWAGLGRLIGNGITLALGVASTFFDTFDFATFGGSLATLFNLAIENTDWPLLGQTIGKFFMAQVNGITGFFAEIKWAALGTNLAKGFMSLLNSIDWEALGTKVATQWNGIIEGVRAFWATYEWGTFGSNLATYFSTAIREINWHNLGAATSETLRGLLRDVTTFLGELDWFSIGKAISEFVLAIDWLGLLTDVVVAVITILGAVVRGLLGMIVGIFTGIGLDISEGFKDGILSGLVGIANWLWEHLVDPVVRAVKGFFGIHSPSTVFADIGNNLIQGLFNGITGVVDTFSTWAKTNLFDPVINGVKSVFGISGNSSTEFTSIGNSLLEGLFSGLKNVGSRITTWGSGVISSVKSVFGIHSPSKEFESIGDYMVEGMVKGIKDISGVEDICEALLDSISSITDVFANSVTAQLDNIAETAKLLTASAETNQMRFTNNVIHMYANMSNASVLKINAITSALNAIPRNIKTTHTIVTRNVTESSSGIVQSFKAPIKMASGGVVTGPTRALIGEGKYDEAVIPLGDSPQLAELIEKIGKRVDESSGNSQQPVEVRVYIGDREWDAFTYKSARRGEKLVGAQPIKT